MDILKRHMGPNEVEAYVWWWTGIRDNISNQKHVSESKLGLFDIGF